MYRKGFTILEIIISISIILILGILPVMMIKKQEEKNIDEVTMQILEAGNLYIRNEMDNQGNLYVNKVVNGSKGVKIPLSNLINKGYIPEELKDQVIDYAGNLDENQEYYVIFVEDSNYCEENQVVGLPSWMNAGQNVYLCNYNYNSQISLFDVATSPNIQDMANLSDYSTLSYISGNDISDDGQPVFFYKGNVKNNYLKFKNLDDKLFRIVRTVENKNVKIVENDVIEFGIKIGEPFTGGDSRWRTYCGRDMNYYSSYETDGYQLSKYYTGGKSDTYGWIHYLPCPGEVNSTNWSDDRKIKMYRNFNESTVCDTDNVRYYQSPYYIYIYKPLLENYNNIKDNLEKYIDKEYKWCDTGSVTIENNIRELDGINFKCKEEKTISSDFGLLNGFEYKAATYFISGEYYFFDTIVGAKTGANSNSEILMDMKKGWKRAGDVIEVGTAYYGLVCRDNYLRPAYVIKGTSKVINGTGTETDPYIVDNFLTT